MSLIVPKAKKKKKKQIFQNRLMPKLSLWAPYFLGYEEMLHFSQQKNFMLPQRIKMKKIFRKK